MVDGILDISYLCIFIPVTTLVVALLVHACGKGERITIMGRFMRREGTTSFNCFG